MLAAGDDQGEAKLRVLPGTQSRHRAHLLGKRRPPSDGPGARPCLGVVADPGKPSAQLDRSRPLALLIEDSADRSSIGLGDDKHSGIMAAHIAPCKRGVSPDAVKRRTSWRGDGRRAGAGGTSSYRGPLSPINALLARSVRGRGPLQASYPLRRKLAALLMICIVECKFGFIQQQAKSLVTIKNLDDLVVINERERDVIPSSSR